MRALRAATVVLLLFAPAVALAWAIRADPEPASRAAAPGSTPSWQLDIDPCLIGTWRTTSLEHRLALPSGETINLTGRGSIHIFNPDGTVTADFTSGEPWTATRHGQRLELRIAGSVTSRYRARDGVIDYSVLSVDGSMTLNIDGVPSETLPLEFTAEPERYTCTATTLRISTRRESSELARITVSPTPPR
ncbi:hypothetical protein [Allorhizocola rhizosphaerae]|uniref:hypothetical protein n=1 Tax=Allorhizocola rhizosphaerae TaxID=1872709 RepID=UPI000E3D02BE|nr:hypothetical protein [Allorhizocola rhizosphaerae]